MPAIPRSLAVFLAVSAGAVQPPPLDRFIATKVLAPAVRP